LEKQTASLKQIVWQNEKKIEWHSKMNGAAKIK
jgi:hypothetical protein